MSEFLHGPPEFSRGPSVVRGPPVGDRWFSGYAEAKEWVCREQAMLLQCNCDSPVDGYYLVGLSLMLRILLKKFLKLPLIALHFSYTW